MKRIGRPRRDQSTTVDDARRFLAKVDRSGECWLWTGSKMPTGRGVFSFGARRREYAPRVAWELAHDERPPRYMDVCHRCDNPQCVRPEHLFLGSRADNMRDMSRKLRGPSSTLTAEQIQEIRDKAASGAPRGWKSECARRFGITVQSVWKVANGRSYRHGVA